eukprot:2193615-Pyramimonas_sp.AAC.1
MQANQKNHNGYSAVTGVTLIAKMSLAMSPDKFRNIICVTSQFEQWTSLVETLEKYGLACSLNLLFRIAALGGIVSPAGVVTGLAPGLFQTSEFVRAGELSGISREMSGLGPEVEVRRGRAGQRRQGHRSDNVHDDK